MPPHPDRAPPSDFLGRVWVTQRQLCHQKAGSARRLAVDKAKALV